MAKFLIQDIMPPEKRKRAAGQSRERIHHVTPERTTASTHSSHREHRAAEKNADVPSFNNDMVEEYVPQQQEYSQSEYIEDSDELAITASSDNDNRPMNYVEHIETQDVFKQHGNERPPRLRGGSGQNLMIVKGIFVVVFLISIFVIGATIFGGATVTITPKHEPISIENKEFKAEKSPVGDTLPYSVMQIEQSESQEIAANGQKTVTSKASGKIIVYNAASASSQRLIKNTRFQAPSGKIYRINESISIPGYKTVSGKLVPGSLEVTVYADEPGPDYNSGPVDLTIPGLKGDPRYDKMYARAKTSFTGGASGVIKQVDQAELTKLGEVMRVNLETKLRTKARAYVSDEQIAFPQGYLIEFGDLKVKSEGSSGEGKAVVELSGTMSVIIFQRTDIARSIAKSLIPSYDGELVTIPNIDGLGFSMEKTTIAKLVEDKSLRFKLNGEVELRYVIDQESIKKQLAGIEKRSFTSLMAGMPMIENARAKVRPFWKSHFPKDVKDITIVLVEK